MLLPVRSTIILSGSQYKTNLLEDLPIFPICPVGPPNLNDISSVFPILSRATPPILKQALVILQMGYCASLLECSQPVGTSRLSLHKWFSKYSPWTTLPSPRNLRARQILKLHPRITKSETLEVESSSEF